MLIKIFIAVHLQGWCQWLTRSGICQRLSMMILDPLPAPVIALSTLDSAPGLLVQGVSTWVSVQALYNYTIIQIVSSGK